ncbi:hypothetical protein FPZ54_16275 [Sphingomonas suaedae]|uniref:Exo-alpha-sialidase n=1 Tax=Sphingomonas suaedae TaxID=2599297 RepID=A0A518RIW9_9SPHN|nr:hypothetical protein [Sphingomonas suaedae]QDX27407.1 hypothetical protein FPZ54_16275 [Sphingomonas suaedae]
MPKVLAGAALAAGMLATGGGAALMSADSRSTAGSGIVRIAGESGAATRPGRGASATPESASLSSTLDAPTLGLADSVIETFHDSDTNLCGTQKVHIDGPVRAFEDQNNVIHLTVSDPNATGWQWTGSVTGFTNNPKTAALDCTPVMIGNSGNTDPSQFDQKTWIQAIHFAGSTVYAYGHQDYFGTRTNDPDCHDAGTTDGLPYCWYSSIPLWTATVSPPDRHVDFSRSAATPDHVAIYPHVAYPGDANTTSAGWIGYGTPSNIIRGRNQDGTLDGYHYMFAYSSSNYAGQGKGVCLFRSADPTDRTSWRAWDGSTATPQFTQQMKNPYSNTNSACALVQPSLFKSYLRSVVWHKPSRHYIAIIRNSSAVQYTTSTDLLTWSEPQSLLVSTSAQANYPVVIDFDGGDYGDSNFDRVYSNGKSYLFYRKSIASGHTRITRRKIAVTNYPADPPGSFNPN